MKKTVCFLIFCLALLALTACGGEESIVGTWTAEEGDLQGEFVFNGDGTGKVSINGVSVDSSWAINDKGLLTVKVSTAGTEYDAITDAEYKVKGDKLTVITGDEQLELTRKK